MSPVTKVRTVADEPTAYDTWCPIDPAVCDPSSNAQEVLAHLLTEHEPQEIATVLIRNTYVLQHVCNAVNAIEGIELRAEREIDARMPHPSAEEAFTEVEFESTE